ncbi:MAG: CDP-alcohol phosphatidyltransferase family protein [Candidatus Kerfeldbacteria bacterium]|nr:CDP-alcohol phosphatidyltransferase family protein [Candidatus Kerfeldbacteria bacterium]
MAAWAHVLVALFVVVVIAIALALGIERSVYRLVRVVGRLFDLAWRLMMTVLEFLARLGHRLRAFVYRLEPLTDYLPFGADTQTALRGLLMVGVAMLIAERRFPLALTIFIPAWMLDFTDGMTAKRRGPTRIGKYLDPAIDIPSIVLLASLLWPYYHRQWLVLAAGALAIFRVLLFGLYHLVLAKRIGLGILPSHIGGQTKMWFIAISFGLILLNPRSSATVRWAEVCLSVANALEALALIGLGRRVVQGRTSRQAKTRPEQQVPRTGT